MVNFVRKVLGKYTRPEYLYVDNIGGFWIEDRNAHFQECDMLGLRYYYTYRSCYQNYLGLWKVDNTNSLYRHTPLKEYEEIN